MGGAIRLTPRNLAAVTLFWLTLLGASVVGAGEARQGVVQRVIDGDTFVLRGGRHVRLIGIDTPEYEPWMGRTDYFGREAAEFSRAYLTGKAVRLEPDIESTDRYGRQLAYVFLESGEFVNLRLVSEGFARAKYYAPNGLHYRQLKDAQRQAQRQRKGLWQKSPS